MPFCPQCGIDNPASARFCDQCGAMLVPVAGPSSAAPTVPGQPTMVPAGPPASAGAPLVSGPVVCPQCGAAAIPGEAFCDNCGAPLNAPARPTAPVPAPPYSAGLSPQQTFPPPQQAGVAQAPQDQASTTAPGIHPLPRPIPEPPPTKPPTLPPKRLPPLPDFPGPPSTQPIPGQGPGTPMPQRAALAPSQLVVAASGAAIPLPNSAQAVVGRGDAVSNFYPDVDLTPYGALDQGVGRRHLRLFLQGGQVMVEDMDSTNGTLLNGQKLVARQPQPLRDGDQLQLGKLLLRIQF